MSAYKILIVDDSKAIRLQVRDMLPQGNFEVSEAKDGIEALDSIRDNLPQLILLDFFMPRMNGWEVLLRIQHQPEWQMIPIVVMTGRRAEAEAKVPEMFQHFEFIEKPFDQKTLVTAVRSAMTKAKQRQSVAGTLSSQATATPHATAPVTSAPSAKHPHTTTPSVSAASPPPTSSRHAPEPAAPPPPAVADSSTSLVSADTVAQLQTDVKTLKDQNARLHADLEMLRLQVGQIMTYLQKNSR